MARVILMLTSLILLMGCQPEPLKIDVPQAEEKIVVSSIILPPSLVGVVLTKSFSALSNNQLGSVENPNVTLANELLTQGAIVTIEYEGETINLPELAPGIYASAQVIQIPGRIYTLKATHPTSGETVSSTTRLPPQVELLIASVRKELVFNDSNLVVQVSVDDEPGANYYLAAVYGQQIEDQVDFDKIELVNSQFRVFSDEGRDGSIITEEFRIENWTGDTAVVSFSNISEDYYRYLESRQRSEESIPFLSEPVTIESNISGGYGFFAMHYPDLEVLVIP